MQTTSEEPLRAPGAIEAFMTEDHARIDRLLDIAQRGERIEAAAYDAFRAALLRHIGMEEKILLPFARSRRAEPVIALAPRLHADHGELAKLLLAAPNARLLADLRATLARHNALEEGARGLYALCDDLAGDQAAALVARLRGRPDVALHPLR